MGVHWGRPPLASVGGAWAAAPVVTSPAPPAVSSCSASSPKVPATAVAAFHALTVPPHHPGNSSSRFTRVTCHTVYY